MYVSFQRKRYPAKNWRKTWLYIQKLDMISSLHTTCGVLDPVIDKSKSHHVMAKFLSIALLQLSKFCPQPYHSKQVSTITKLLTRKLLIWGVQRNKMNALHNWGFLYTHLFPKQRVGPFTMMWRMESRISILHMQMW